MASQRWVLKVCFSLASVTPIVEAGCFPWLDKDKAHDACPANSHYDCCGKFCSSSCGRRPVICLAVLCVEGCFCDQGYMYRGKECIVKEKACACNHEGHYYQAGEEFWADAQCQSRCVCDADKHKITCKKSKGCEAGQTCRAEKNTFCCL